jgi:hypothetical protein
MARQLHLTVRHYYTFQTTAPGVTRYILQLCCPICNSAVLSATLLSYLQLCCPVCHSAVLSATLLSCLPLCCPICHSAVLSATLLSYLPLCCPICNSAVLSATLLSYLPLYGLQQHLTPPKNYKVEAFQKRGADTI